MLREFKARSEERGVKTLPLWTESMDKLSRLLIFILLAPCSLLLANPVLAARPLITEDAVVAGKGITQLEVGIDYTKVDNGEGTTFLISPIHGVMEDTEFSLRAPYIFARPEDAEDIDGWGDVSFIMKHLFITAGEKTPSFLVQMSLKLPTGDEGEGLGTGETNVSFLGALTKEFKPATIHINIGYTFVGDQDEDNDRNEVNYSIAGEYGIGKKTRVVGEIYGLYHPEYQAKEIERRALLGLTYRLDDTFTIDLAGKRGLEGTSDEYGFIGGVTITF